MDMSSMPPGMVMPTATASSTTDSAPIALSTEGLNMSDVTVQTDFLAQLLNDSELQITSNFYARAFWYGIVVAIALASVLNLLQRFISRYRLRAASKTVPAKSCRRPGIIGPRIALVRKLCYPQHSPVHHPHWFKVPPFGTLLLIIAYLCFILGLEYVNQNVPGEQHNQAIGVRAGWLTITQIPLLILLSGKVNLIGLLSGMSYERLNVLHRWVARTMLLTATLHMGYQQALWNRLGLLQLEWSIDTCPPTGIKAYAFLVWMNLSTLAPIRNRFYEFFIIQHILSFVCFITFIMLHLPSTALYTRVYIWTPIGLYILDRLLRTAHYAWNNVRPGRATLTQLHGGVTKIVVKSRQLKKWTPGSFVLLSIPRFGIIQSHPATIASTPSSNGGDLVFILRAHHGFTSRVHKAASSDSLSPDPAIQTHLALIDGPYGGTHLDFASFTTVVLIAGSTGITFALPILVDLAFRAQTTTLVVREVVLIWAIKTAGCLTWIEDDLRIASERLRSAGIELSIKVFVTADTTFVEGSKTEIQPPAISQSLEDIQIEDSAAAAESSKSSTAADEKSAPPAYKAKTDIAVFRAGRPDIRIVIAEAQERAGTKIGVAVCGPLGMTVATRRAAARLQRGDRDIYLHVESFGF
ncbi:related to ferric reductase (metalloreductase) [Phialocephala subalpina]|uniref:ferric-chelate reductase (NADPH) n=1 Tax=Phialocephala subalpina TaxID=576137 RepID=A0A1L7X6V1_9HELO|nr:related to ferric reductase (metalloreductase) [Phialocephala subalpina]